MATTAKLLASETVIWRQGFSETYFGVTVSASIAVIISGSSLFIEIELLGNRARYNLAETAYSMEFGVGRFVVGLSGIEFSDGRLVAFCIKAELCIGVNLPPFGRKEECWTVFNHRIQVSCVGATQALGTLAAPLPGNDRVLPAPAEGEEVIYLTQAIAL